MDSRSSVDRLGETVAEVGSSETNSNSRLAKTGSSELDFVVAGNVVMMAEKTKDTDQTTWIHLKENDISVKVNDETFSRRPSRTKFFFNPKMRTNREMAFLALLALVREKGDRGGDPLKDVIPVDALDAFAASGIGGMRWKKVLRSKANVFLCENDKDTFQRLLENCQDNGFRVRPSYSASLTDDNDDNDSDSSSSSSLLTAFNEDCNVVMLVRGFDFVHLDPFGSTVHHLDAAFRNVRQGGVVVLTSTDTGSLFGKVPTVAKRNYDAFVTKTEYFRELAARMTLAAAARAAAKCNKGIQVLYVVAMEHFVQTAVRICRGAQSADKTVEKLAKIVHCLVCEERSVIPNSNHPVDAAECLVCDCTGVPSSLTTTTTTTSLPTSLHHQRRHRSSSPHSRGRNRILLGPVWCGSIFDADFVDKMENIAGRNDSSSAGRKRKDAIGKGNQVGGSDDDAGVDVSDAAKKVAGDESNGELSFGKTTFSVKTREILNLIKAEAVCSSVASSSAAAASSPSASARPASETDEESASKRRRVSQNGSSPSSSATTPAMPTVVDGAAAAVPATSSSSSSSSTSSSEGLRQLSEGQPLFYYNTHSHLPKGLELLKVERVVDLLRKEGFGASRTHFDSTAVRTTATASQLKSLAHRHCHKIPAAK